MESLQTFLYVVQALVALALIVFILIQHGKGADAGAAFGSGASSTVFGSQGSGNFLTRTTTVLAFCFLANSLALAYIATQQSKQVSSSLMQQESIMHEMPKQTEMPVIADEIPELPDSDVPPIPE